MNPYNNNQQYPYQNTYINQTEVVSNNINPQSQWNLPNQDNPFARIQADNTHHYNPYEFNNNTTNFYNNIPNDNTVAANNAQFGSNNPYSNNFWYT